MTRKDDDRGCYKDPTFEAAHRLHEANKRAAAREQAAEQHRAARRRDWRAILRRQRRIQALVAQVMSGRRG